MAINKFTKVWDFRLREWERTVGVHLALGIWKEQLASVPVGLRMDSCFPSRYKLHDKKRRWELWGPSHPLTTWLVLPWISVCLHFPTLRLGFETTWASAQTYASTWGKPPMSVLSIGPWNPGRVRSVFHVSWLRTAFSFQIRTGISRNFRNQMRFVKQGLCLP